MLIKTRAGWKPSLWSYFTGPSLCSEEVEKNMCFLGLLMMKNLVKPQSAEVINTLRRAQLRCIMITGERFIFNLFSYTSSWTKKKIWLQPSGSDTCWFLFCPSWLQVTTSWLQSMWPKAARWWIPTRRWYSSTPPPKPPSPRQPWSSAWKTTTAPSRSSLRLVPLQHDIAAQRSPGCFSIGRSQNSLSLRSNFRGTLPKIFLIVVPWFLHHHSHLFSFIGNWTMRIFTLQVKQSQVYSPS